MTALRNWLPIRHEGRKQPLGYQHVSNRIAVLGHYESPCGGCDTIGSARAVYDLIQKTDSPIILCEGLLLSEDVKWSSQLQDLHVLYLITPLDQCLSQIEGRRRAAGNHKPLNPSNTSHRVEVINRSRIKLEGLGVHCRRASSSQAAGVILRWINNYKV
jgi:hypothetical protein